MLKDNKQKIALTKHLWVPFDTLLTVNDVTWKDLLERPRGIFIASVGAFYLRRLLKSCKLKFLGVFPCDIIDGPTY